MDNDGTPLTHYRWLNYYPMLFDEGEPHGYDEGNDLFNTLPQPEDTPLRLDNQPDGKCVVDDYNGHQVTFYVWGSKECYFQRDANLNADPLNVLEVEWSGLIIFKQADLNNERWNKKTQYPLVGSGVSCLRDQQIGTKPNFVGINITINANSKVVVLSGEKAFNRMYFDNGGGVIVEEGVKLTSSCNMWGGIMVDNRSNCIFTGLKLNKITVENANVGITIANDMMTYPLNGSVQISASFPFGSENFAINPASVVQLNFAVFTNNYFDIYALAETSTNSFITNCEFYTNSTQMLPPYEPKNGQLTATEAAIVLYICKVKRSFHTSTGEKINISDCIFSTGILTDILIPTGYTFTGNNEFYYPMLCAIRYYIPKYGAEAANYFNVENQKIYIRQFDDNTISSYKHQIDFLDSYWNTINGFYNDVIYTCDTENPFVYTSNPNIARHGLSTGYPKIWNTNFSPRNGCIGIFTPYEVFTGNTYNSNVRLTCKNVEFVGDTEKPNSRNFGIYTGALVNADNNKFRFLENGITTEQASYYYFVIFKIENKNGISI